MNVVFPETTAIIRRNRFVMTPKAAKLRKGREAGGWANPELDRAQMLRTRAAYAHAASLCCGWLRKGMWESVRRGTLPTSQTERWSSELQWSSAVDE